MPANKQTKNSWATKIMSNLKATPKYIKFKLGEGNLEKDPVSRNTFDIMKMKGMTEDVMKARNYSRAYTNIRRKFKKGDASEAESYINDQVRKIKEQQKKEIDSRY